MRVLLQDEHLVLVPESEQEAGELGGWKTARHRHVFLAASEKGTGLYLADIGPEEEVRGRPVLVGSGSTMRSARLISNFAETPFVLDERRYVSVESFWQGLKFDDENERERIAGLSGRDAWSRGRERPYGSSVRYQGSRVPVGTWEHWRLMFRACDGKFRQHEGAREALLSTAERPLVHAVGRDSRTIPGVILCEIWMTIRSRLRAGAKPGRRAGPVPQWCSWEEK